MTLVVEISLSPHLQQRLRGGFIDFTTVRFHQAALKTIVNLSMMRGVIEKKKKHTPTPLFLADKDLTYIRRYCKVIPV